MAVPSCPRCAGTTFEAQNILPIHGKFKVTLVNCASCGTIIGVTDYRNVGKQLLEQNKVINQIAARLQIKSTLQS